jgi:uncharacterized protein YjbI with pentapeptide repeats
MLKNDTIVLSAQKVRETISSAGLTSVTSSPDFPGALSLDRAVTDIRVCSFLSFNHDGALRFAHKSFFEFFVAQSLAIDLHANASIFLKYANSQLGREILYFLGSFARDQPAFGKMVTVGCSRVGELDDATMNFFFRIAFASGVLLGECNILNGEIDSVDLRRASITGAFIRNTNFDAVSIRDVDASDWKLDQCVFKDSTISNSCFTSATLSLNCDGAIFDNCRFDDCELEVSGTDWSLHRGVCCRGEVRLGGGGLLINSEIVGSNVTLMTGLELSTGSKARFKNCVVTTQWLEDRWYDGGTSFTFSDCQLAGMWLDTTDVTEMTVRRQVESRPLAIALHNCEGVVLVSDYSKNLTPQLTEALGKSHPKLLFCDVLAIRAALDAREKDREVARSAALPQKSNKRVKQVKMDESPRVADTYPLLKEIQTFITAKKLNGKVRGILAEVFKEA